MRVDLADATHALFEAEDLIHGKTVADLARPVVFDVEGEDRVPYDLRDALTLLRTTKVGAFTRCPLRLDQIAPLLLVDSRLPVDSPTLERYRLNHVGTLSGLLCQHARRGEQLLVRALVQDGADINAREATDGGTALHMAVANGRRGISDWLLAQEGCDLVGVCDDRGRSPYLRAVAVNDRTMVEDLLRAAEARGGEATRRRMVHSVDRDGESALTLAIRHGFTHMVPFLLAEGRAPVNAFDVALSTARPEQWLGRQSLCPVIVAIESNWPALILSTLVREGADLAAARAAATLGAMAVAAIHERATHIRALMRLGLTPDADAFRQAAIANRPRILRFLAFPAWRVPIHLREHDDDDENDDSSDEEAFVMPSPPPINKAAGERLVGGAVGVEGRIPPALRPSRALVAAVRHDAFQAAETLRDMGARTTSALVEAVQLDRLWAVRLLAVEGALPPAWPDWEDTPLTLGVRLLRTSVVLCLAEEGRLTPALLNARRGGKDARTALDLALEGGLMHYVDALRAAGGQTAAERAVERAAEASHRAAAGDDGVVEKKRKERPSSQEEMEEEMEAGRGGEEGGAAVVLMIAD